MGSSGINAGTWGVAPVTSSRTHSHATQLFWILNIIIVTIIIALFYYPKTPKI